jgi:hypothetical protein
LSADAQARRSTRKDVIWARVSGTLDTYMVALFGTFLYVLLETRSTKLAVAARIEFELRFLTTGKYIATSNINEF